MSQLQMILGEEGVKYALWSILGLAVIILALIIMLVLRRLFGSSFNMSGSTDRRNRPARLGVTDFFNLDRHGRTLVIVRRDNVEHLVLIGGPNDLLIEQSIIRGMRPELPVVDTSSRPTVSAKLSDDPYINMQSSAPKADLVSMPVTVSRLNIPKLNVPNLDLRSATPAPKPAHAKSDPVKQPAPLKEPVAQTLTPEPPIPVINPTLPIHTVMPEKLVPSVPTPAPINASETIKTPEPTSAPEPVKHHEPAKQPILSAFGDATKRLEEALRRPTPSFNAKQPDKKTEPTKDNIKDATITEKSILPEKLPEPASMPATKSEAQPKIEASLLQKTPIASSIATDTLVLDLEQEMARLLGRIPGKGA